MAKLDPRMWAYGEWFTPGTLEPLDPQPPAPPQDENGNATGMPAGYEDYEY